MGLNALSLRKEMLASIDVKFHTCNHKQAIQFELTRLAESIEIIDRLIHYKHLDNASARTQFKTQRIIVRGELANQLTEVDEIVNTALIAIYPIVTSALGFDLYYVENIPVDQPDIDHLFM